MLENTNEEEEKFSDDPKENLKIENELLRLKLKAQFGDGFNMQSENSLPPEIENKFLNQILAFENNYQNAEFISLGEKLEIDKPRSSEGMTEQEVTSALKNLEAALDEHHIYLDRIYGPYPDKLMYDFIVNELLQEEVEKVSAYKEMMELDEQEDEGTEFDLAIEKISLDDEENDVEKFYDDLDGDDADIDGSAASSEMPIGMPIPGFKNGTHFIYEEFHPNHEKEIENNTLKFMQHWEARSFDEYSTEMDYEFVTMEGKQIKREVLYKKMYQFFDSFTSFENFSFMIGEIAFSKQQNGSIMGHSEGAVKYDAVLENGEQMHFNGPYKLYMVREDNVCSIMHFVFEGFSWDGL